MAFPTSPTNGQKHFDTASGLNYIFRDCGGGVGAWDRDQQRNSYIADPVPIGAVMSFVNSQAPSGWLLCDGSTHNQVDYPNLFNFLVPSPAAGQTSFTVPDLRGQFLRGRKAGDAVTELLNSVDWTTGAPKTAFTVSGGEHKHDVLTEAVVFSQSGSAGGKISGYSSPHPTAANANSILENQSAHSHSITGGDAETAPDHTIVDFYIKAEHSSVVDATAFNFNATAVQDQDIWVYDQTSGTWRNQVQALTRFGQWSAATDYKAGDITLFEHALYKALTNNTASQPPAWPNSSTDWEYQAVTPKMTGAQVVDGVPVFDGTDWQLKEQQTGLRPYDGARNYKAGELCLFLNGLYQAKTPTTAGTAPTYNSTTTEWEYFGFIPPVNNTSGPNIGDVLVYKGFPQGWDWDSNITSSEPVEDGDGSAAVLEPRLVPFKQPGTVAGKGLFGKFKQVIHTGPIETLNGRPRAYKPCLYIKFPGAFNDAWDIFSFIVSDHGILNYVEFLNRGNEGSGTTLGTARQIKVSETGTFNSDTWRPNESYIAINLGFEYGPWNALSAYDVLELSLGTFEVDWTISNNAVHITYRTMFRAKQGGKNATNTQNISNILVNMDGEIQFPAKSLPWDQAQIGMWRTNTNATAPYRINTWYN